MTSLNLIHLALHLTVFHPKIKLCDRLKWIFMNWLALLRLNLWQTVFKKTYKKIFNLRNHRKDVCGSRQATNIYKMNVDNYRKLLRDNITSTYKKADKILIKKINQEAKHVAEKLKLDNRIECLAEKNSYITSKDHKDNFYSNPQCRLINPTKLES